MGANQSGRSLPSPGDEVNFDHFQILRAIGKGSFGKVCIVQKRDRTGNMYAMKYVHKVECAERGALKNIAREVEILSKLEHPCLVNLWFSFQDEEDLFMVSDLLLGGDLRYHIQQEVQFCEDSVVLFVTEIALALDYLQEHKIIHRDIKPDNILLDEEGHAHVTDFNIATVLEDGQLATSMSGTKPYIGITGALFIPLTALKVAADVGKTYKHNRSTWLRKYNVLKRSKWTHIVTAQSRKHPKLPYKISFKGGVVYLAPEVYMCSCEEYGVLGYGFAIDWWSLGILAWETLAGVRPYPLHAATSHREALAILQEDRQPLIHWSPAIRELLDKLLIQAPGARISTLKELKQIRIMNEVDLDKVLAKQTKPPFTPPKDHLNCDPTFELEEMIIETKPLHKKKKRLAKQRSIKVELPPDDGLAADRTGTDIRGLAFIPEYKVYNRERELERQEREKKERQWEEELNFAMMGAEERLRPKHQTKTGSRLSVSTASVKARINASPRSNHRKGTTSSDIDFIDASPEPSSS